MNREAWFIFVGMAVAAAVGLFGTTVWRKQHELAQQQRLLAEAREAAAREGFRRAETEALLNSLKERAAALEREVAGATNAQQRLETEMRSALRSRDVAISALQGRLTVNILDRILFDSGEAALKPEGTQVLDEIARVLAGFTNRQVQVSGHTDNVPIRLKFASNWELSAARAVAAVRYLSEKAGVDPRRLSAVGCGEFQPVADNATPEGRARNRRIAVVVLPEEFAPTDVIPAPPPQETNSPAQPSAPLLPAPLPTTNAAAPSTPSSATNAISE